MKIIEPSFSLQTPFGALDEEKGIELLKWVEFNARISHRSEDRIEDESWRRFIQTVVVDRADWSVTEHASITAVIRTDRGITHELVRHRLFSFTQESTRFVRGKQGEGLEFIKPSGLNMADGITYWDWRNFMEVTEGTYFLLLNRGERPQEARSVLPNALAATISMTGNLRSWRWFFMMRTSKESHPDMRRITVPMLAEFKRFIPILYNDIEPESRQTDNLKKGK